MSDSGSRTVTLVPPTSPVDDPHLLVNRWTAVDPAAAITPDTLHKSFQGTGVSMQTARQDRNLHEAFETGAPCI